MYNFAGCRREQEQVNRSQLFRFGKVYRGLLWKSTWVMLCLGAKFQSTAPQKNVPTSATIDAVILEGYLDGTWTATTCGHAGKNAAHLISIGWCALTLAPSPWMQAPWQRNPVKCGTLRRPGPEQLITSFGCNDRRVHIPLTARAQQAHMRICVPTRGSYPRRNMGKAAACIVRRAIVGNRIVRGTVTPCLTCL